MTNARTRIIPIRVPGFQQEPTLEEILADPITEALMQADAVQPAALDAMLRGVARARDGAGQCRVCA